MTNCPFCNNPLADNQIICIKCGKQIKPLETRSYDKTNCRFCNSPITRDQIVCMNCGRQIKPVDTRGVISKNLIWIIPMIIGFIGMLLFLVIPGFFA